MQHRSKHFLTAGFLFAAMAGLPSANAQPPFLGASYPGVFGASGVPGAVPIGSAGQALVARFYAGIDCAAAQQGQVQPTGFGTAALYFPFMIGIPTQYLFKAGATVQNETTAVLTGVFSKPTISTSTNYNMTNTFLGPQDVKYYYHPNSTPAGWTDFDGFQAGTLIATYHVNEDMFTTVNNSASPKDSVSYGVVSGPFTFTTDFILPNGQVVNLKNLMPGGITAHTISALGNIVADQNGPTVVNLTNSTLGSCAAMIPFSGVGTNPASPTPGVTLSQ